MNNVQEKEEISQEDLILSIKSKVSFYKNNVFKKHPRILKFFEKNLSKAEMDYIFERTKNFSKDLTLKNRISIIYNDIWEIPRCIECGKEIDIKKMNSRIFDPFKKWCSISCAEKHNATKQKIINTVCKNTLESSENIINIFQLDSVKRKCKESIGKKFNDKRIVNPGQVFNRKEGYENYLNNYYVIPLFSYEEYNEMCFMVDRYHNKELKWKCKTCGKEFKTNIKTKPTKPDGIHETNISCPYCNPPKGSSMYEKQVVRFLKTIYSGKIEENNRTVLTPSIEKTWINPHEIDIWIPDLNYAIEFNGTYHHADPRFFKENDIVKGNFLAKDVWKSDNIKIEAFNKLNIEYSIIWQYDWTQDQNKIKNNIKNKLLTLQK